MVDLLFIFFFTAFSIIGFTIYQERLDYDSEEKREERYLESQRIQARKIKIDSIILTTTDYVPNRNVGHIIGIVEAGRYENLAAEAYRYNKNADAVIGITSTKVDTIDGLESFYVGTIVSLD